MSEAAVQQHFRLEEAPFIQQGQDWIFQASDGYQPILTPFLNPRQRYILQTLVNQAPDLQLQTFGGQAHAEMQRAIVAPDFYEMTPADFEIALLTVRYPVKFAELHHATILGSVVGSGLERNVLGDILNEGSTWQLVIASSHVAYVQQQITQMGKTKVSLVATDLAQILPVKDDWRQEFVILSSLRLDTLIASGYNIARSLAKQLVESGSVQLNWAVHEKPDTQIAIGDVVSVRKYGRLRIADLLGNTRKDKIKAHVDIITR